MHQNVHKNITLYLYTDHKKITKTILSYNLMTHFEQTDQMKMLQMLLLELTEKKIKRITIKLPYTQSQSILYNNKEDMYKITMTFSLKYNPDKSHLYWCLMIIILLVHSYSCFNNMNMKKSILKLTLKNTQNNNLWNFTQKTPNSLMIQFLMMYNMMQDELFFVLADYMKKNLSYKEAMTDKQIEVDSINWEYTFTEKGIPEAFLIPLKHEKYLLKKFLNMKV